MTTTLSIVVLLVCGLPACGKSTLIKALVHKYHSEIVNDDNLNDDNYDDDADDRTEITTHIHTIDYDQIQEEILQQLMQQQQQQQQQQQLQRQVNRNTDTTISECGDDDKKEEAPSPSSSSSNLILLQSWRQTRVVAMQRLEQLVRQLLVFDNTSAVTTTNTTTTSYDRCPPQPSQQQRHIIFCDDNFYLRSMRKQIYRRIGAVLAHDHPLHHDDAAATNHVPAAVYFGTIHLETDVATCQQRNQLRHLDSEPTDALNFVRVVMVTEDTIQRMHERFEVPVGVMPPTRWDEAVLIIPTATWSSTQQQVQVVEEWIQRTLHPTTTTTGTKDDSHMDAGSVLYRKPPPCSRDDDDIQETQQQMQNDRHRADVFWRQCVSAVAQSLVSSSKIQLANQVRKYCIQQLQHRQGLSDYDADVDYDDETKKVIWWNMFVQGTITKLPSLLLTISTVESTTWLTPDEQQILYRSIFPK